MKKMYPMRIVALAASLSIVGASVASADDARPSDPVVNALVLRNAERDAKFDEQAKAQNDETTSHESALQQSERSRAEDDRNVGTSYTEAVDRARRSANHKTGLLLATIGLAIAATGALCYYSADIDKRSIRAGGFSNADDIGSAADMIVVKQGISYGAVPVGTILLLVATGVAW